MDNNLDSVLSSVMSDENLMNKIRDAVKSKNGDTSSSLEDVISLIAPTLKSNSNTQNTNTESVKTEQDSNKNSNEEAKSSTNSFVHSLSHTISKNAGLLLALKPYLSKERCQMIDGVVKISQIADTLKLL